MSKFFYFLEIRGRCAHLRNGPNPKIGHCAGRDCDEWLLRWFLGLTGFLKPREHFERSEEFAGDGAIVTEICLPPLGRSGHEAHGDGIMRIQVFGAVLHDLLRAVALRRSGDVEDAGFDATGAEAAPVRLRQT
jgi:hypothetical protein